MTSDEAISILTSLQEPEAWEPQVTEKVFTALQMAIEALAKDINVPSNDCISRKAAIDTLIEGFKRSPTIAIRAKDMIEQLPSGQPERKRGKWIDAYPDIEPNPMFMYGICSVCGCEQAISNKLNFCPDCGADMREVTT